MKKCIRLTILGFLLSGSIANAGQVVSTFTGDFATESADHLGLFGLPGSSLEGVPYIATFSWDTSIRPAVLESTPFFQQIFGGSDFGSQQLVKVDIEIGNHLFTTGDEWGRFWRSNGTGPNSAEFGADSLVAQALGSSADNQYRIELTFGVGAEEDFLSDANLVSEVDFSPSSNAFPPGYLQIIRKSDGLSSIGRMNLGNVLVRSTGNLIIAPIPEPATWAMMVLGFGLVGGALRSAKCRQKPTVSYA